MTAHKECSGEWLAFPVAEMEVTQPYNEATLPEAGLWDADSLQRGAPAVQTVGELSHMSLVTTGETVTTSSVPYGVRKYMLAAKRWLVWKPDKRPFYLDGTPRRGVLDAEADRNSLGTYEDACKVVEASQGQFAGVGFALGPDGSGRCWQGIDLDRIPSNGLHELANNAPGYVELSPSGEGIHAIGYGRTFETLGPNGSGVEAYANGRYFTFTGHTIRDAELVCIADYVEQRVAQVHGQARGRRAQDSGAICVSRQVIKELRSALLYMRADDRELWIRMGMALRELGENGRGLWLEWSATSAKFKPEDARTWDSFNPIATGYRVVFAEAQRQGWPNPNSSEARFSEGGPPIDPDDESWVVSVGDVLSSPSPKPEFLTEQLMPAGEVTLFAAHGGTGKSLLMLMWAVHAALGRPFLGKYVLQAPVIFYSGEDRADVVRFRLAKICEGLDCDPTHVAQLLTIVDATDDPVLFTERIDGGKGKCTVTTRVYDRLKRLGDKRGARYFFIDNASDTFDADEIKRAPVRHFLRALRALGAERRAGVMLAAHVDKQTAKGYGFGQEYSGSTAWNNSARSRLFLEAATEEEPDLLLKHGKSNHGRLADAVRLRWTLDGLLQMCDPSEAAQVRDVMNSTQMGELVRIIESLVAGGINIPTATSGSRTTFHVLQAHPEFPRGMNAKRTNELVQRAEMAKLIRREEYEAAHRKRGTRWAVT